MFNSKEEREKTIIKYIYIVKLIAKCYAEETEIDVQELEEIGYEGLILAIDKFNTSNQKYLSTYLHNQINRYIKTNLSFFNHYYELAQDTLQQHKEDLIYKEDNITRPIEYEEWTTLLKNSTRGLLSSKEQRVIDSYYGFNNNEMKSFGDIAKEMGYSDSYIYILHKSALRKLRIRLRKNLKYFKEVHHDIDAETGYAMKKRKIC